MHSTEVGSGGVPAFLAKLWRLVEDQNCQELISWTSNGTSFIIKDQTRFSKELLPLYFKHNNMASFIRQLNMYGFRKVTSIDQGSLRFESDAMEFQHQYFLKDHEYLLELIKRKVAAGKTTATEDTKVKPEILNRVLVDVKHLRNKQENVDSKLAGMKRENEALWREIASLRQKHSKQQQIVNKLIQFLLTFVQPNRGMGHKRKIPLMINDTVHMANRQISYERKKAASESAFPSALNHDGASGESGPVIHDVTDVVDAGQILKDADMLYPESNYTFDVTSPEEAQQATASDDKALSTPDTDSSILRSVDATEVAFSPVDELINAANTNEIMQPTENSELSDILVPVSDKNLNNRTDFIDHIDNMQTELDSIKDLLSSSGCTIDASALLEAMINLRPLYDGLSDQPTSTSEFFSADDSLSKGIAELTKDNNSGNEIMGMELTQYHPNLLELTEDDTTFFDPENDADANAEAALGSPLFDFVETILDENPAALLADAVPAATPLASTSSLPSSPKRRKT